jgi:hypothetical protein
MQVWINDRWINLPSRLRDITLKQRIVFQAEHGNLLDEMYNSIMNIEDLFERELEFAQYQIERMYHTLSFYLNCTIESLKNTEFVSIILACYQASVGLLQEEEMYIEANGLYSFEWNKEIWQLHAPELKNGDKMSYGEFLDSKQIIQNMVALGKNRWECLLPLCTVYLRKEGEAYDDTWLIEGSERMKLMESVPLDIALQVGFFLSSSLNMLVSTFQSSGNLKQKELADI